MYLICAVLYWAVIVRGRYKHWCRYCCQMNSLIVWSKPPQKSPLACPRKRFTPGSTSILPSVSRIPRETSQNTYRKPIQYLQKPQWIPTETSQNIPGETLQNTYRNLTEYLEKDPSCFLIPRQMKTGHYLYWVPVW